MNRYLQILLLPLILLALGFQSCIHEYVPLRQAGQVKVYFSYRTESSLMTTKDSDEVKFIDLFVFNQEGSFIGRWTNYNVMDLNEDYVIELPLQYGEYKFVTWASNKNSSYKISPADIEQTTNFDEMLLFVQRTEDNVVDEMPDRLFHAHVGNIVVNMPVTRCHLSLTQVTNTVQVTTEGIKYAHNKDYSLEIIDNNGDYKFDGSIAPNSEELKYIQNCELDDNSQPHGMLRVMRLGDGGCTSAQLRLVDETSNYVIYQGNLSELIAKLKEEGKIPDNDVKNHYHIHLKFTETSMDVEITINGWKVVYDEEDLWG